MFGTTWSGKSLGRSLDLGAENSPLLGAFDSDEESSILKTRELCCKM